MMKRFRWLIVATVVIAVGFNTGFSAAASKTLDIRNQYSPFNHKRPFRSETRYIVLHTTEGALEGSLRKVYRFGEAHYFVTPKGEVYRIIDRKRIATHTGRSMWQGRSTLDDCSIGIEVVGYHDREITAAQYTALGELLRQLKRLYRIKDGDILTHSMVAYGRPNSFHRQNHRGRKRCGMIFADPTVRARLGLPAGPARDPDVAAKRLAVGDPELYRFLYQPSKRVEALTGTKPSLSLANKLREETLVIAKGVNAWSIAREKYNHRTTLYEYPDGRTFRGDEIREWNAIPVGTHVSFADGEPEGEQAFEGFLEIGKDGKKPQDLAGDLYGDASTIYFFPSGLIRTGAELKARSSLRKLLNAPPNGTRLLVGYIYGGCVRESRAASRIAGRKWNYPSTFYRFPDGRILSGDKIDDATIPARTLIFAMK